MPTAAEVSALARLVEIADRLEAREGQNVAPLLPAGKEWIVTALRLWAGALLDIERAGLTK